MSHLTQAEVSREPRPLLKHRNSPVNAVKTFACKVSASFRRHTACARQKYLQTFRQLEAKLLNSSQEEAGLIFAVPSIPAHITPAELASAFNDTLARLCDNSQEIHFSSTFLSSDPSHTKDLLDLEYERYPPLQKLPQATTTTTPTPDLLLPELSDLSTAGESRPTSQSWINDLLCRQGLDELQAPLLPAKTKFPKAKAAKEGPCTKDGPLDWLDFLGSLSFDDLNPYPLITNARTVKATMGAEAGNKRALRRKQRGSNLRRGRTDNLRDSGLPQSLRPGPLNPRRAAQPRSTPRPIPVQTYTPSKVASSPYVAYNPGRAPVLPVPFMTSNTLMEDITNKLEDVLEAFKNTAKDEGIPHEATPKAHTPDPLVGTLLPIVPLRISPRAFQNITNTTPERSLSFRDRLLEASRSAILAAADEAVMSDLRWFHCRS